MLRRRTLILLFTLTFLTFYDAIPQDTLVSKAYIQPLEERVRRIESNSGANGLSEERYELLNDKIENLQSESQISSAGIANQIAASSNTLTLWSALFALFGIGIAVFVGWMENRTAKNLSANKLILLESKGILELQKTTKDEVLEVQSMINNNIKKLYDDLQAEEVNYLINEIYKQPGLMTHLFARFLVLRINNEHLQRLVGFIAKSFEGGLHYQLKSSIFIIILNKFPKEWLNNKMLKEHFLEINEKIGIIDHYQLHNLVSLVDNLCEYLSNTTPEEIDFKLGSAYLEQSYALYESSSKGRVIPEEVKHTLPHRQLTKYFYNKLAKKELRFDMYDVLRWHNCGYHFWRLLTAEYANDQTNTPEQTELLNICKDVYESASNGDSDLT